MKKRNFLILTMLFLGLIFPKASFPLGGYSNPDSVNLNAIGKEVAIEDDEMANGAGWISVGPEGGTINTVAIDPKTPSTLYVGTEGGVFKSTNAGTNWFVTGLTGPKVRALAINPLNPNTLYAGTSDGVFKSTDGGTHWVAMNSGLTNTDVQALVIDPKNTSNLYVGTFGGLFKSTDGGLTWAITDLNIAVALAIDPINTNIVYSCSMGCVKSTDGGATWSNMRIPSPTSIHLLVIDPVSTNTLYAVGWGALGHVYKSTDGGNNWAAAETGLTGGYYNTLVIDPETTSTLYVGCSGGMFKSIDGGNHWVAVNTGLGNTSVLHLVIDPQTPATLYAWPGSLKYSSPFKTTDGGTTWNSLNTTGLTAYTINVIAVDPINTNNVYAGTSDGVFKSIDGGVHWTTIGIGLPYNVICSQVIDALAIDPANSNNVYAGTRGCMLKSTDGGIYWGRLNIGFTNPVVNTLGIDPISPNTIYSGTESGIYKSTDGGTNWVGVNNGLANSFVIALVIDPTNPNTLYAGTYDGGIFKSTGGGASWVAVNTGLTNLFVPDLAIDPKTPSTLYAGTAGGGVFKSTDGGNHWNLVNNGLTNSDVFALVVDPTNPNILYAGTNGGGVFKSSDGGANWATMNTGLTANIVNTLAIDPKTPTILYAGTVGGGVYKTQQIQSCSYTLTVNVNPAGSGTVTKNPDKSTYCPNDQVTLTATQNAGYSFSSWSGDLAGNTNPATVTMDGNKTVTANFTTGTPNGTANRDLPDCYTTFFPSTVSITTTPSGRTNSYAVEDVPPNGWTVSSINENGQWDDLNKKIKWGPFFDHNTRTLTYQVTPPGSETGSKTFSGAASFDGRSVAIFGESSIDKCTCTFHPADTNHDSRISMDECTAYGSAWKTGQTWPTPPNPIPIEYVTNAGYLWRMGEVYHCDPTKSPPWIPGTGAGGGQFQAGRTSLKVSPIALGMGTAIRDLPNTYVTSVAVPVSITITPDSATFVYAVEEAPPVGWVVSSINENGQWDNTNKRVKWGPFFDSNPRTLTYQATPPSGETGVKTFSGTASFDGRKTAIGGGKSLQ